MELGVGLPSEFGFIQVSDSGDDMIDPARGKPARFLNLGLLPTPQVRTPTIRVPKVKLGRRAERSPVGSPRRSLPLFEGAPIARFNGLSQRASGLAGSLIVSPRGLIFLRRHWCRCH
jgi:hypothetical protein